MSGTIGGNSMIKRLKHDVNDTFAEATNTHLSSVILSFIRYHRQRYSSKDCKIVLTTPYSNNLSIDARVFPFRYTTEKESKDPSVASEFPKPTVFNHLEFSFQIH